MQNKLAHTSEHVFIGSLQKLMGKTLNVRKVEHRDYDNLVLITAKDIEVDSVIEAEREVNSSTERSYYPLFRITGGGKKSSTKP